MASIHDSEVTVYLDSLTNEDLENYDAIIQLAKNNLARRKRQLNRNYSFLVNNRSVRVNKLIDDYTLDFSDDETITGSIDYRYSFFLTTCKNNIEQIIKTQYIADMNGYISKIVDSSFNSFSNYKREKKELLAISVIMLAEINKHTSLESDLDDLKTEVDDRL